MNGGAASRLVLKPATFTSPAVTLNYGQFLNTVLDFLIVLSRYSS
jgi:large-conductance mechanosensitive channel